MPFCMGNALLTFHLYTHAAVGHAINGNTTNSLSVPVASAPHVQNKRTNTATSMVRTFLCHRHTQTITLGTDTTRQKSTWHLDIK